MTPPDDIDRWSRDLANRAIGATLSNAMRRASGAVVFPPQLDDATQALLIDRQGMVIAGWYVSEDGTDIGQDIAAQLSGVADEAERAARLLELGEWRSMLIETEAAGVALAPADEGALTLVAAPRSIPLGMVRRHLARASAAARLWLGGRA